MTKDVDPYAIVGGIAAKVIRYRFEKTLIDELIALQWWRFSPQDLLPYHPDDPNKFVELFSDANNSISPLEEIRLTPQKYFRQK